MATPPTFVAEYETAWNTTTSPKTASVTTAVGDVVVLVGVSADNGAVLSTPTGGTSLTWTLQQSVTVASYCRVTLWTATATTAETFTCSVARTGDTAQFWGWNCLRYSGSAGIGASSKTNVSSGAPSLGLTTTGANSAIVIGNADWSASDGASRVWRTVGAAATEQSYFRDASFYTVYVGRHVDSGTAGAKTVGLSDPSAQKYSIAAVEVLGTSGVTGTLSSSTPSATSSATGTVTVSGTLSASTPKATSSVTGTVTVTGTLAASTPKATSAATGAVTVAGTLSAATPRATSSATGSVTVAGSVAASTPRVTSSITGTVSGIVTGTLAASTPLVTSTATGTVTVTGTMATATPRATTTIAGTVTVTGTLSGTTPDLTGTAAGTVTVSASATLTLPLLVTSINGTASGADLDRSLPYDLNLTGPDRTLELAGPSLDLTITTPERTLAELTLAVLTVTVTTPVHTLTVTTPPDRTLDVTAPERTLELEP